MTLEGGATHTVDIRFSRAADDRNARVGTGHRQQRLEWARYCLFSVKSTAISPLRLRWSDQSGSSPSTVKHRAEVHNTFHF